MITWEEFKATRNELCNVIDQRKVPTSITCPKCGGMVYRDDSFMYARMPAQHKYFCDKCGWSDFA